METVVNSLRKSFGTNVTKTLEWRRAQLQAIDKLLDEYKNELISSVKQDLNKPAQETMTLEIGLIKNSIVYCMKNLNLWTKPQKVSPIVQARALYSTFIQYQPLGVCLIIGAWNYPLMLSLVPLVGAIASGNCVIIKPSELSPSVAKLLEDVLPKYLDENFVKVVNGGIPETTELLKQKFDHIFYTGNGTVGRIVMEAAAKHMTPVVLECGGKSPVYIDETAELTVTARRILWGKFANAGQTCICPDYVLCSKEIQEKILPIIKQVLQEFYGESPKESDSFARIVNQRHFDRILNLIDNSKVVVGGESDRDSKYISPTVMFNVTSEDKVMGQEIFGPILPFVTVANRQEAIDFINARDKPLALYVFANDDRVFEDFQNNTSSGSFGYNEIMVQCGLECLPFGGVGESGMGSYHGRFSIETFSHKRAVLKSSYFGDSLAGFRYPPYSDSKTNQALWATSEFKSCSIL